MSDCGTGLARAMRFTDEGFRTLARVARDEPELWRGDCDFGERLRALEVKNYEEPVDGLFVGDLPAMPDPADFGLNRKAMADSAALEFSGAFSGLELKHLRDGHFVAWLNCFRLRRFGLERFPPRGGADLGTNIAQHFFPESARDIMQPGLAGRLLWLAEAAARIERGSGGAVSREEALAHFCRRPDDYHQFVFFSALRGEMALGEFARALLREADGCAGGGAREIARALNREAGGLLLDALPRGDMRKLAVKAAKRVMSTPALVSDISKLIGRKPLKVLSLGAGVQSSALALMASEGYRGMEKPDFAIFADTGWEPQAVYDHLDWLESQLSFKIYRIRAVDKRTGRPRGAREELVSGDNGDGFGFVNMPVYVRNLDGKTAVLKRQCTTHYKLNPIFRFLRERLGAAPGRPVPKGERVEMWLGISADEAARQKPSREAWITNRWPLLERGFSRAQLVVWFKERWPDRELPKSACIGCPYHSDAIWKDMKMYDRRSWDDAVDADRALRAGAVSLERFGGEAFLHRSRTPLEDVAFEDRSLGYGEAMDQECEGVCGV